MARLTVAGSRLISEHSVIVKTNLSVVRRRVAVHINWKYMSAQYRHNVRPSGRTLHCITQTLTITWLSTCWVKNWHIGYSFPGERLHQFCFFFSALFLFRVRSQYRTDRWTDGRARPVELC